jgi:predicted RNA-binding Zn ribbon-like protein
MIFAHDTEISLQTAAALVNTAANRPDDADTLTTPEELDAFVTEWQYSGSRTHDQAELDAVRALRPVLLQLWKAPEDELVAGVNQLLVDGQALPQLTKHDHWSWHLHATTPDAPLATRMAVEAAMALVDVVRSEEMARLQTCAADDCDDVLIDLSKNRSRRYCDGGCGNKANVAAYRARKAREARRTGQRAEV